MKHFLYANVQVQSSVESQSTYDLYILVAISGLSYRKYSIKPLDGKHPAFIGSSIKYKRRDLTHADQQGQRLFPVVNNCYQIMFDQNTNLMHSITDRWDCLLVSIMFRILWNTS